MHERTNNCAVLASNEQCYCDNLSIIRITALVDFDRCRTAPCQRHASHRWITASENLRKEAALALGEIGGAAALYALERAAHDPDPEVCESTRLAIAQIGSAHDPAHGA